MRRVIGLLLTLATLARIDFAQPPIDPSVIEDIKREASQNSQVMDHAFFLSDVYGPRLTDHPDSRGPELGSSSVFGNLASKMCDRSISVGVKLVVHQVRHLHDLSALH
jgi:hypothetical protein